MRKFIIAALLAAGVALPAAGADLKMGVAAYRAGDYATALQELRPLAAEGNAEAQFALGGMYVDGKGVPQDYAQAVHWWLKAAEQGHALGGGFLGDMYDEGKGVPQNYTEAYIWYSLAVAGGETDVSRFRDEVAQQLTLEKLLEAQREATSRWEAIERRKK
ncbi:MAG: tetratricopeptide repeat protein [Proteobacteria bacterium]|nr:tetratricopeptide repeat protein [Pseudomonadota bacterium]